MNRHFNIIIFGLLVAGKAYCQSEETSRFSPQESFRELTAGVGLHAPLKGDNFGNTESCYVLDYAVYGYSGIGFHGGLKYIPEIRGISDCFEVPIKIAWRSPLRGRNRWREQWPEAVASTIENRGNPLPALLLLLLPQRIEFNAGITPGYIFGSRHIHQASSTWINNGAWYDEGVLKKRAYSMSLDIGIKLSYRIRRFVLSAAPQFHYYITDNFRTYSSLTDESVNPGHCFFSLTGGLGFMF